MKLCNSFVMLAARVALGVILIAQGWQKFSEWTVAVAGLMLAAGPGTTITVAAAGTDAEAALAAITELVESKFNEEGI